MQAIFPLFSSNVEDIECEFCTKVVQHWIDQWKANSTQEEFKEVLDSICKKLGQPDRINRLGMALFYVKKHCIFTDSQPLTKFV